MIPKMCPSLYYSLQILILIYYNINYLTRTDSYDITCSCYALLYTASRKAESAD